jgi:hypothetical protein
VGEQPGQVNLGRGGFLAGRDLADPSIRTWLAWRVGGEAGNVGADVGVGERGDLVDGAGEEAVAEGAERYEPGDQPGTVCPTPR